MPGRWGELDVRLAEQFIDQIVLRHNVQRGTLSLHADRGGSMRSKPVAALLVDLGISKNCSWPYVSDDNPPSKLSSRP